MEVDLTKSNTLVGEAGRGGPPRGAGRGGPPRGAGRGGPPRGQGEGATPTRLSLEQRLQQQYCKLK